MGRLKCFQKRQALYFFLTIVFLVSTNQVFALVKYADDMTIVYDQDFVGNFSIEKPEYMIFLRGNNEFENTALDFILQVVDHNYDGVKLGVIQGGHKNGVYSYCKGKTKSIHFIDYYGDGFYNDIVECLFGIKNDVPDEYKSRTFKLFVDSMSRKENDKDKLEALLMLSELYEKGEYVNKDLALATVYRWYGASFGYAYSMYRMYLVYKDGEVLPKDDEKAIEWLRKCVAANEPACYYYLGNNYIRGGLLEEDMVKAKELFEYSFKNGVKGSAFGLGFTYIYGNPDVSLFKAKKYMEIAVNDDGGDHAIKMLQHTNELIELLSDIFDEYNEDNICPISAKNRFVDTYNGEQKGYFLQHFKDVCHEEIHRINQ